MENVFQEVIKPSKKLEKYTILLILILLIFISLFIFNYFYIHFDKSFYYLVLSIILIEIIISKYYKFVKIFCLALFLSLMNNLMNIGIFFQSGNTIEKHKLKFYYNIFTIFLHFISIIISFKTYKEMRVIFMEEYESSNNGSELEEYSNKDDG